MTNPVENCPQPETEIRERAWTAEQEARQFNDTDVVRVARALCKDAARDCGTNADDEWTFYSGVFKKQAVVAIKAFITRGGAQ